jgi:hypothetical protein
MAEPARVIPFPPQEPWKKEEAKPATGFSVTVEGFDADLSQYLTKYDPTVHAEADFDLIAKVAGISTGLRGSNIYLDPWLATAVGLPGAIDKELSDLRARVEALEASLSEHVVVLRELSRDDAKRELIEFFRTHETAYPSDAAGELRLDAETVRDLCAELARDGVLRGE